MEARMFAGLASIFLLLSATTPAASVTTTPDPITTATTPDPTTAPIATTTAEPTTTAELTTSTEPTTTTAAPTTTTTAAPTTTAATTAAKTTAVAQSTKVVTFTSRLDTFTSDLEDSSSAAFKSRASMIEGQLDPIFKKEFNSSYISMSVVSFSNGSIINTINVNFKSASTPSSTEIRTVLVNAASSVSGFDIEGSSIIIDGSTSSGVSHKISLVTTAGVVLTSWLLSSHP